MWAFQNDDSTIYFQDQYYKIRTLDKHRLELYADEKFGGGDALHYYLKALDANGRGLKRDISPRSALFFLRRMPCNSRG
jgi:hypothetical protein